MFHNREDTVLPSASQNTVREHGYMHTGLPSASRNTVREHGYMHSARRIQLTQPGRHGCVQSRNMDAYHGGTMLLTFRVYQYNEEACLHTVGSMAATVRDMAAYSKRHGRKQ